MSVLQDTRLDDLEEGGLATNDFTLPLFQRLLEINETSRCHAIVIACHSLIWFFRVAKDWTKVLLNQSEGILLGDVNLDGMVDLLDVAVFVQILTDDSFLKEADINEDCVVDLLDIAPFVQLLLGP